MKKVYLITSKYKDPVVYESARDAVDCFVTTCGNWRVHQGVGVYTPLVPKNALYFSQELRHSGELTFAGEAAQINAVDYYDALGAI